jgi:hypothetical protein
MLSQEHHTYHVVCHDCSFESLTTSKSEARELSASHGAESGHQTRYARIE